MQSLKSIALAAALGIAAAISPVKAELASLPQITSPQALPGVLSEADAALYAKIFKVQEDGQWKTADKLIGQLGDDLLLGHVMAQRYLHPTKYRSRYKELKGWLAKYADHHYAGQIYKLALKRKPKNWRNPRPPVPVKGITISRADSTKASPPKKRLSKSQRRQVRIYKRKLRNLLRQGWTKAAKNLLKSKDVVRLFSYADMDWGYARLAQGYFKDGRDEWAVMWAERAAKRSGEFVPEAHWIAALAHWRLGNHADAAKHFEASAKHETTAWTISASAFWAARANLVAGHPDRVASWLGRAADYPRTFYGVLALKTLGLDANFDWTPPSIEPATVSRLVDNPGGRRALALIQLGMDDKAERELRMVAGRADAELAHGIMGLATRTGMASLAVRLNAMLHPDSDGLDDAAYPVPMWQPEDGFKVDRALIYALARQESRFNPKAKSGAGARGLMQLMPGTASFVARDRRYRWSKKKALFDPEHNMALGQRYIQILLKEPKIKGDLFLMATAWNGGPGNLNKWRRKTDDLGDPLFFIESLPARETRIFVERVLTNLWAYRSRLGQPTPSLDALAAGQWPSYTPLGQEPVVVAENE